MICNEETVRAYGVDLDRLGRSPNTSRNYVSDLNQFLLWTGRDVPMEQFDGVAMDWLNAYRRIWQPRTSERRVTALRGFARWTGALDPLRGYTTPTPARPVPHPIPEGIPGVLRLIDACGFHFEKRALIAMTGLCGLRIAEALSIRPEDVDYERGLLTVYGKGSKVRVIPMSERAANEIAVAYARAIQDGRPTVLRWKDRHARATITRLGVKAGLTRPLSSHDLRATFATAAYAKSKDLRAVQELLGHSSSATTELYTGISLATMRAAAEV
jgi:site-specific recombinase XerD